MAYKNVKFETQDDSEKSKSSNNLGSSSSNSKNMTITSGGSYDLSGEYESITVNTNEEVTLNLDGVEITNSNGPGINVVEADSVTITLSGINKITSTTTEDLDGAIYSKADLVFSGTGSLEVKSNYDGIISKDTLTIKNGTYTINSDDDGIRGKDSVEISDGTFTINAGGDGIKLTNEDDEKLGYISIAAGNYNITAKNDGIKAITNLTIDGGNFDITSTEGFEATYVKINDGTINISVTGQSTFDYDGTGTINGGTVICNGEEVTTLPNQFMGGGMKGENFEQMNQNGERPQMPFDENMQDENRPQMPPNGNMQNRQQMKKSSE